MDQFPADIETDLINIQDMSVEDLRSHDGAFFEPCLNWIMHQVERPRFNLGGAGPPGRVD